MEKYKENMRNSYLINSSKNSKILYSDLDDITSLTTTDTTNTLFSSLVSVIFSNSVLFYIMLTNFNK